MLLAQFQYYFASLPICWGTSQRVALITPTHMLVIKLFGFDSIGGCMATLQSINERRKEMDHKKKLRAYRVIDWNQ